MAVVYLAHDIRHDRSVALKVLHPELAQTLGPERFQREIHTAARLQHPHILTVHDSGEAAGQLWFTMPFVEGESLRDRLRRERQLSVDDDRGNWGIVRAEIYHLRDDRSRTIMYADSARLAFEEHSRATPDDPQQHAFIGLAQAYLGHKADAIREGQRGVELASGDQYIGAYIQFQLVRIYILVGEPDKGLDQLEPLLRVPFYLSPGWLRIDPTFDPLRKNPRFMKLVEGTA